MAIIVFGFALPVRCSWPTAADPATTSSFLAAARAAGVEARDGTREPLDGWRGDPEAVVNDIRRLHPGEAFIIHGGQALKLRVRPPRPG